MLVRVLLAIDDPAVRRRLERLLRQREVVLVQAGHDDLWERLTHHDVDLIVATRATLPESARSFVADIRKLPDRPEVIVLETGGDPEERAGLLAAGCLAVLEVGTPDAALRDSLRALTRRRRDELMARLRAERTETRCRLNDFVSASPVMQRFMATAARVVQADSSLLILGETGVGKERLARAIHSEGPRGAGPFVAINCGALPESLLESELFGHEEGAFTGASRSRRGYFELAHRGTIFLDEIGEMPLHLQVKLLRVLEDRRILRVGSERPLEIDVRVIAATNKDLEAELQAKRFRSDLFFRLAVVTLSLPPLRERREDIRGLVENYLEYFRVRLARQVTSISAETLAALEAYGWPGNVRELINVIEQVVLLSSGPMIELSDLPRRIVASFQPAEGGGSLDTSSQLLKPLQQAREEVVAAFERSYLSHLLRATKGRINEAACQAGITSRHLHDLMKEHGLRKEDFRSGPDSA